MEEKLLKKIYQLKKEKKRLNKKLCVMIEVKKEIVALEKNKKQLLSKIKQFKKHSSKYISELELKLGKESKRGVPNNSDEFRCPNSECGRLLPNSFGASIECEGCHKTICTQHRNFSSLCYDEHQNNFDLHFENLNMKDDYNFEEQARNDEFIKCPNDNCFNYLANIGERAECNGCFKMVCLLHKQFPSKCSHLHQQEKSSNQFMQKCPNSQCNGYFQENGEFSECNNCKKMICKEHNSPVSKCFEKHRINCASCKHSNYLQSLSSFNCIYCHSKINLFEQTEEDLKEISIYFCPICRDEIHLENKEITKCYNCNEMICPKHNCAFDTCEKNHKPNSFGCLIS